MDCQRFETLLSDSLAGRLDTPVDEAMSRHEETCIRCQALARQVRRLREELAGEPQLTVRLELIESILRKTSGLPKEGSFWHDLLAPTLRPFYSQRFAFATLIMFVFISVMVNVMGPEFSAYGRNPSLLMEKADQVSSQIYGGWRRFNDLRTQTFEEAALFWENFLGRLDYHLITLLFREYDPESEAPGSLPAIPENTTDREEDKNEVNRNE